MHIDYRSIARLKRKEVSNKRISEVLGISRNSVIKVVKIMDDLPFTYKQFEEMDDENILDHFRKNRKVDDSFMMPDYSKLEKELARKGVTMQLLCKRKFKGVKNPVRFISSGILMYRFRLEDIHYAEATPQ